MVWKPVENYDRTAEVSFETSAIRKLHRIWFPWIPVKRLESICGSPLVWENYSQYLEWPETPVDLTFARDNNAWKTTFHDLLHKPVEQLSFMKVWQAEPSDALVFPVIGIQAVVYRMGPVPEADHIVKRTKDGEILIITDLRNFAKLHDVHGFNMEY